MMKNLRVALALIVAAALVALSTGEAAPGAVARGNGGNSFRRQLGIWNYDCETCGITCSISSCRGENDSFGCSNVYCRGFNDDFGTTPVSSDDVGVGVGVFMTTYLIVLFVTFGVCYVIPCFFMCCSINSFQTKEANLPLHMRTLDESMKWAFVGATCCFGFVGWAIMHCVIQSRIDQQIMMVNAGLGGTGQAGMMQPQYVQPGAQMQMQQPQMPYGQPQQAYVVSEEQAEAAAKQQQQQQ